MTLNHIQMTNASTPAATGTTFAIGQTLTIVATFFGATGAASTPNIALNTLAVGATSPTLTLSNGATAVVSTVGTSTITFTYVVQAGDSAVSALTVTAFNPGTLTGHGSAIGGNSNSVAATSTLADASYAAETIGVTCFLLGTRILTPGGERAIEDLKRGDLVMTADGVAKPVKWIGTRHYEASSLADGAVLAFARPVLIRAGALGDGLPRRDLRVSPMHGVLIDGYLFPAASLVNGATILRELAEGDVDYLHLEFDEHEIIISEGAPSESYTDQNSRALFDNATEFDILFGAEPAATPRIGRIESGYMLEVVRNRLAALAGVAANAASDGVLRSNVEFIQNGVLYGWATEGGAPVEIEVEVAGEVIGRALANGYRTDLEIAGLAGGRCGFVFALPPSVTAISDVIVRRTRDGALLTQPAAALV